MFNTAGALGVYLHTEFTVSRGGIEFHLGYTFRNRDMLTQALTHRSHGAHHNERLEFMGDGVLNCVIAEYLFLQFPQLPEGDLSRMRAHFVRESTLGEIATQIALGEALRMGEGELKSAGWRRPSVLADALEALIGAVFYEAGYDTAKQVVLKLFNNMLTDFDPANIAKDAKSRLQEHLQGKKMELPHYRVTATSGEAHCQLFEVECAIPALDIVTQATGSSRRIAEQEAAKLAFAQIESRHAPRKE